MTATMASAQIVLIAFGATALSATKVEIAFIAAIVVAAIAFASFLIDRRFTIATLTALFLGDAVAIAANAFSPATLFAPQLAAHLLILAGILAVAWIADAHKAAVLAVPLLAAAAFLSGAPTPGRQLAFAAAIYALFLAYPLLLRARVKQRIEPHLAAMLAGVPFFFLARTAIRAAGFGDVMGLLPIAQAVLTMILLWQLLRIEAAGVRMLSRLALVAAATLAFITVAIPLQLHNEWVTLGWALEAAALVWLFRRITHRGLLTWSLALFAAVFVRLVLNQNVFAYHPVSHMPIVNWYLYTYLVAAASFFAGATLLPRDDVRTRGALAAGGTILLFAVLNIEIADYYSTGRALTFNFFSSSLAQDLTYTIGWAVFAVAMLIAGLALHSRPARIAAIVLLLATVLKCFLHDLARLGGLYRVGSLLGLALSLVLVGVLLQKFVLARTAAPATHETT
jgi:uncharacterized membrane protein